ncbi:hypothetical protein N0B31_14740 [Salinirubellus salinus]|uniref:Uncharacterized protein n=1 Tax=Salinirubellus salinus TaxID=1364945 RepID=A0A9E7R0Q0_9EURY|nr:hypothetical protein [Salinirubellus salinus]UWM53392.1 hypothetical protein N0B31_14740 [Salinirubellus salinus]
MKRRSLLRRTSIGLAAVGSTALAGCTAGDDEDGEQTPLPNLQLSDPTLESSVDGLSLVDSRDDLRRGQQHEDVHFAVVATVENAGAEETDLGDYQYTVTLYDGAGTDITPGDTWTANAATVAPGETGTILLQVSFIESNVTPRDVGRYEVALACGGDNSGSYLT